MSEERLTALRNALETNHQVLISEKQGNDYDVSAIWVISRPDGKTKLHIEFDGLDDMKTLSIEESFGCSVREIPNLDLYFARINRTWDEALLKFVDDLNEIDR